MFKKGLLMTLIDFDSSKNHWHENIFLLKKLADAKTACELFLLAR